MTDDITSAEVHPVHRAPDPVHSIPRDPQADRVADPQMSPDLQDQMAEERKNMAPTGPTGPETPPPAPAPEPVAPPPETPTTE